MLSTTLITDFDNTLYDWFHMWYQSFSAMLDEIERISEIDRADLIPEIRAIHQRYGTSEYAFLVEKLPILQKQYPDREKLLAAFDPAIHAYRSARKANLQLYDGVAETLTILRARGVMIVLYTDSLAFYTTDRIKRLGLDEFVDFIYSPPDHEIPESVTTHTRREKYKLAHAQNRHLKDGEAKPNPEVLRDIIAGVERTLNDCVYLGDSLTRDIAMAQDAGVKDIWAAYGAVQNKPEYTLLRQVSHWKDSAVQLEKTTTSREVVPTNTISQFSDIKRFFEA